MSNKTRNAGTPEDAVEVPGLEVPVVTKEQPGQGRSARVIAFIAEGSFGPNESLQDLVAASLRELNDLGYTVSVQRSETEACIDVSPAPPPAPPSLPSQQASKVERGKTVFAATMLSLMLAFVLLLVYKGFDTLLIATATAEGSKGVAASMKVYLEALAPFVKIVLGGGAIVGAVKIFRRVLK